jgi:two-component system chemotaxis response regulator CheB
MAHRDLVVVGGSAGGLESLLRVLDGLPGDFRAAVLVVLHIPARGSELLPSVIQRRSAIPVAFAGDGAPITPGTVTVAPPDHHLLVTPQALRVVRGPRENRHRPAIDPLFHSAVEAFGPRVIGVILSGSGGDGAAGMAAIQQHGGRLLVQHPQDALFASMPQAVLDVTEVDATLHTGDIAPQLLRLVEEQVADSEEVTVPASDQDQDQLQFEDESREYVLHGSPSPYSCPDCGGVLWVRHDGSLTHYRCRVGHAYSTESLLDAQQDVYEAALWTALRALEEKADLYGALAQRAQERGQRRMQRQFVERQAELAPHIATLRAVLTD